ncbi:MAG: winged helix DNA-binding domain-containing protein, partial [Ktedonobacterales bacterium]
MMAERVLTLRELNRATLARQLLLERAALAPPDAVERLVAMQGQVSNAPYIGLWTRLQDFQRADLSRLLEQRQVVRASSLRGTLHLMSAEDYLHIHPILQPALSRNLHLFARQTPGFDMERFTALMRSYVQEQPHTAVELRARMEELYPGMGQPRIADSVRMHLALIQPSPAGLWGFTGKPTHTEATAWLGRPLAAPDGGSRRLVLRYLAAFGPASVQDIQTWSGVSRLQQTVDILRPELLTFRDEQGREFFDLPHAPRPPADTPAPVRILPDFDNLLFSHADRRRVIADEHRSSIFIGNSRCTTFLVDGFVRGTWKIERTRTRSIFLIEPIEPLTAQVREALREEGEHLMRWMTDGKEPFDIQIRNNA